MGNNCCIPKPPPLPEDAEALILVVGNHAEYKTNVARALAKARGATKHEVTKAGVRVFTKESNESLPRPVVMDTVRLRTDERLKSIESARMWVTQNSLRRLCGKLVFVVCVISATNPNDEVQLDFERSSWLHVLACIFEKHKQEILILVNSNDRIDKATRLKLIEVLKRTGFTRTDNIIFSSLQKGVDLVLRHSIIRGTADDETTVETRMAMAPFLLAEVAQNASDKERYGPFGPENVIVFGGAGSGKSTLAQMLTLGRLDANSKKFSSSSSLSGETRTVNAGQGRGWRVIDTPGLGEPNDDAKSTVSTDKAARLILEHVLLVEGTYFHFLYVWKKSRVHDIDTTLWKMFVKVVGKDLIQDHTTVVVTEADQNWLHDNINHLKKCFVGCESFFTVDFPPIAADDAEYEEDLQEMRLESLKALEDELASLCRIDTSCKLGMWSIGTQRSVMARGNVSAMVVRPAIRQTSAFGPSAAEELHPSDYETARTYIKLNSIVSGMASTLVPSKKLDLRNDD